MRLKCQRHALCTNAKHPHCPGSNYTAAEISREEENQALVAQRSPLMHHRGCSRSCSEDPTLAKPVAANATVQIYQPPPSQWLQARWCPAAESARVDEQQALVAQDGTVVHHRGCGFFRVPGPVSLHTLLAPLTLPLCVYHLAASQPCFWGVGFLTCL